MKRTSIARDEIRTCKTLGLLGQIFRESMKLKASGIPFLPLQLGDPAQFDFPPIPSFKEGIIKALEKPSSYGWLEKLGFSFEIKACEKFYRRHIHDIPRIKF